MNEDPNKTVHYAGNLYGACIMPTYYTENMYLSPQQSAFLSPLMMDKNGRLYINPLFIIMVANGVGKFGNDDRIIAFSADEVKIMYEKGLISKEIYESVKNNPSSWINGTGIEIKINPDGVIL